MIEVKNFSIKVKNKYLIENLTFSLTNGDKMAIIGEEGNGKSTLLKAILGLAEYAEASGNICLKGNRVGYLEQSLVKEEIKGKVYDFLFQDENEYYEKVSSLYQYLEIFQLNPKILKQSIKELSGGESVKIRLLKLLIKDYDVLFLDEPTNDLDIETLEWLENFINSTQKPIIYISHDETLLAKTATIILHIEQIKKKAECRHTLLKIDYETYVQNRLHSIEKQTQISRCEKRKCQQEQEKLTKIMQRVEYQQNTISRKDPHGAKVLKKKMHSLKSQEKKLNNKNITELPTIEESIFFCFEKVEIPKMKQILSLDIPKLKAAETILARNIKLDIIGNSHICIIGKNGIGKSTLIKQIYEKLKDRKDIKLGYMPQNYGDILNEEEEVLHFLEPNGVKEDLTRARMYLGNMNFTKEEMAGKVKALSNGTKAKLFLTKLVLEQCNVLLLDEVTRNISPLSNPVIRKALKEYQGTIISVSHDRKYIEEVIDNLYTLTKDGLIKM